MGIQTMPRYTCHKEVNALKIQEVGKLEDGSGLLIPVNPKYDTIKVSKRYMDRSQPRKGGYYVKYDDNYESYSPAKQFESGYSLK